MSLFKNYKIGIVVSRVGLTDTQLAVVRHKLSEVARYVENGGHIELYVPGWNIDNPEGSLTPEVANLQYKDKVRVCFIGLRSHERGAAAAIVRELERLRRCDEIWCCPALSHTGRSQARVAQVYELGRAGPVGRLYKRIGPWVEMPDTSRPKKKAKEHQRKEQKEWLW